MGRDSFGVDRGKCNKLNCKCRQFLYDKDKGLKCSDCGHVPTAHIAIREANLIELPVNDPVTLNVATATDNGYAISSVVQCKSEQDQDSQGIARGPCIYVGCACPQFSYMPQRGPKCTTCGHAPVKHKKKDNLLVIRKFESMNEEEIDEMQKDSAVPLFVRPQRDDKRIVETVQGAENLSSPLKSFSGISLLSDESPGKLSDHLPVEDIEDDNFVSLPTEESATADRDAAFSKVKRRLVLPSQPSSVKQEPSGGPALVPRTYNTPVKKKKKQTKLASHTQSPPQLSSLSAPPFTSVPNGNFQNASGSHSVATMHSLPVHQATAANPVYKSSPAPQTPAVGGCIYPGCTKPVYVEPGRTHQFCGRTHAQWYQHSQTTDNTTAAPLLSCPKCSNPNCNRVKFMDQNGQYLDYCGKSCRNSFRQQGSQTKLIHPADACLLPGCGRVRCRAQDGTVYDYCGKTHANQAKKSLLRMATTREFQQAQSHFDNQWVKGTRGKLHQVLIVENPKLRNQFQEYLSSLSVKTVSQHYHGTSLKCAIYQTTVICSDKSCGVCGVSQKGFLMSYKSTNIKFQRFGDGFYLAPNSSKCHDYTQGHGQYRAMLLFDVAEGNKHTLTRDNSSLKAPPSGCDSVYGRSGGSLNYDEIVVYTPKAVLPTRVLIYEKDGIGKIAA